MACSRPCWRLCRPPRRRPAPDLPDPHLLRGGGSTVRSVRLTTPADVDERVADLLEAAIARWPWTFGEGPMRTDVVAESAKRRPRR